MYKEPINPVNGIEPEELEIEKSFASPLDKEPFSEYSSLTYKNVPQPQGKVFRSNFDVKIFLQEKKIEELQQEYDRLINKINELNDNIQPLKLKNRNILDEYGKIKIELKKVNEEIANIKKDISILKNKYREEIKKKELKLLKRILMIGAIIPTILTIISLILKNPYLINDPVLTCGYIIGMPMVFGSIGFLGYLPFRDKYLSKLEKEYMQTEDYQNLKKQLEEKTKTKEEIEQKLNLKEKELEDSNKKINITKYQIDILIRNIKRIKEELIELILPDSKDIETKYQYKETSLQEETKTSENELTKKLIP